MLRTDDLDYHLPPELIATEPASVRDSARLLVVHTNDPTRLEHLCVRDLPDLLEPNDLLVRNATRVLPARFTGVRTDSGGKAQGLYLHDAPHTAPGLCWSVLIKSRRQRPGVRFALSGSLELELIKRDPSEEGAWIARVHGAAQGATSASVLDSLGLTPLPPYILQARKRAGLDIGDELDRAAYQTVFASEGDAASVAAPTAGLHFTPELLAALKARGIRSSEVVLHVGTGTFKPVEAEFVEDHPMHAEACLVREDTPSAVEQARAARGRVVAIGTTSARTLESFVSVDEVRSRAGRFHDTSILIAPGHTWRHTDALLTNFHLPRSTLLAMVAALFWREPMAPADAVGRLLDVYREAIERGYRFYSYGDAMLVLP